MVLCQAQPSPLTFSLRDKGTPACEVTVNWDFLSLVLFLFAPENIPAGTFWNIFETSAGTSFGGASWLGGPRGGTSGSPGWFPNQNRNHLCFSKANLLVDISPLFQGKAISESQKNWAKILSSHVLLNLILNLMVIHAGLT